jgi:hypothetical protein
VTLVLGDFFIIRIYDWVVYISPVSISMGGDY